METRADRRRRKLRALCTLPGHDAPTAAGIKRIAAGAGLNWQALDQVLKQVKRPSGHERTLGDDAAQAIESALNLGRGWFDTDGAGLTGSEWEVVALRDLRELPHAEREAWCAQLHARAEKWRDITREILARYTPPAAPSTQPPQGTPEAVLARVKAIARSQAQDRTKTVRRAGQSAHERRKRGSGA